MLFKYKDCIITVLCFVFVGMVGFLIITPVTGLVIERYEKLMQDRETLRVLTEKANKLANLDEAETRSQLMIASTALPSKKESFGLVSGIEQLVATSGGSLESVTFSPGLIATSSGDLEQGLKMIPFTLVTNGDPYGAFDFVKRVYKVRQIIGVESISFNDGKMTLEMMTYFQEQRSSLGDISSPIPELTAEEGKVLGQVADYLQITNVPAMEPVGKPNLFGP